MLAKDIKERSLLELIIIRVLGVGGHYEILSGHRRVAAQKMNGEMQSMIGDAIIAITPMQWDDSENAGLTTGIPWISSVASPISNSFIKKIVC